MLRSVFEPCLEQCPQYDGKIHELSSCLSALYHGRQRKRAPEAETRMLPRLSMLRPTPLSSPNPFNWLLNHRGRVITSYQIADIFGKAYERNATLGKGIKGFEVCGIFPVNRNVFSDDDFLPSSVTDQTIPVDNSDEDLGLHEQIPTDVTYQQMLFIKQNLLLMNITEKSSMKK
ncbi:hypothetical protein J6590_067331 [Homalodisca vitripennis]|nr:hypothetical protein J6590_067331 [Homalodisca vitripennis]